MLSSTQASRMAKRPRQDTQRSKVYAAEGFLWGDDVIGAHLEEVQSYVNKLTDYEWFRRRWGSKHITVKAGRGAGGRSHGFGHITIGLATTHTRGTHGRPPGAQRHVVLHEIAHEVSYRDAGAEGNWHG